MLRYNYFSMQELKVNLETCGFNFASTTYTGNNFWMDWTYKAGI